MREKIKTILKYFKLAKFLKAEGLKLDQVLDDALNAMVNKKTRYLRLV